jgi:hypothetical protein
MIRRALALSAAALLVAVPPILGAVLRLDGGSLAIFTVKPSLPIVEASLRITPGTLARQGHGSHLTVLIEAPDGAFDVRKIVPESIRLCRGGPLCDAGAVSGGGPRVGDADHDGVDDLSVAFSRPGVLALVDDIPVPGHVTLVVSALLSRGTAVSGADTVMLVDRGPCASGGEEPDAGVQPPESPEDSSPSPSPSASPGGASAEPAPSIVPAPTPDDSAPPSSEPSPPLPEPTPTPGPSDEPTIEPSPMPEPSTEPTPVAAPTPDPTPAADQPVPSPPTGDEAP